MDWTSLYGNSRPAQELLMWPDPKVYKAIGLLKPEDRPRAPVRTYEVDSKKFPAFKGKERTIGGTIFMAPEGHPKRAVMVNTKNPAYETGDLIRLAGILAHEGEHLRRQDFEESPAYKKEYEAVRDIRGVDMRYVRALQERMHVNRAIR